VRGSCPSWPLMSGARWTSNGSGFVEYRVLFDLPAVPRAWKFEEDSIGFCLLFEADVGGATTSCQGIELETILK
jgi:hypothetical protein